jgi:pimeloyl-ACP methyl ester carboxylesterase
MTDPVLSVDAPGADPKAIALVLHGGRANGRGPVRGTQLAVVRMSPFATSLRRAGRQHGLVVARLRYRVRGWNRAEQSPVADVEWALDQLTERFRDIPIALVGHSMGGRAAIYSAGHAAVSVVVGLAPWLEPGDPYEAVKDRHVLIAHGDHDRITNARESAAWTRRAAPLAASAAYVTVRGERHAMLRRPAVWHTLTTGYVLTTVLGVPPEESTTPPVTNAVMEILAGQPSLVV